MATNFSTNFSLFTPQPGTEPARNYFGLNTGSKDYAKQTQAALLRANWDYSRAELEPLLNRMLYMYNNPQGEQNAVDASRGMAGSAFDAQKSGNELTMRMQGLALTPAQKASYDKTAAFERGLATGGAGVMAARGHDEMRQQIAAGT